VSLQVCKLQTGSEKKLHTVIRKNKVNIANIRNRNQGFWLF